MTFAPFKIKVCTTQEEINAAFAVRELVFVDEYGYAKEELTHNAIDNNALQVLATDEQGTPLGSCRFTPLPQDLDNLPSSNEPFIRPQSESSAKDLFNGAEGGRFWWLAVSPKCRGRGLAGQLIKFCEEYTARAVQGQTKPYMRIRANFKAHSMYPRFGYAIDSEPFLIADQKLIWMKKVLGN